jgi:hypothetical protein
MNTPAKFLVLTLAGVGAFLGATQWSRQGVPDAAADEIEVLPASRRGRDITLAAIEVPASGASAASASTAIPAASAAAGRQIRVTGGSAFAPLSWLPPPPPHPPRPAEPPPPPPPPPRPVAPPLPFVFVGMAERGADRPQAYLAKGEVLLVVAVGDLIENRTYRVDALSPSGVLLTYLPLDKQQMVNAPGGNS